MSNEPGRFEAESVAALSTPIFSAANGRIGTLIVVAADSRRGGDATHQRLQPSNNELYKRFFRKCS
jgi:hypothetical protein